MTRPLFSDLTNQEFGKLWVIGLKEVGRHNPPDLWLCGCKCGNSARFMIPGEYLRTNEIWSCGCDRSSNHLRRRLLDQLIIDGVVVATRS